MNDWLTDYLSQFWNLSGTPGHLHYILIQILIFGFDSPRNFYHLPTKITTFSWTPVASIHSLNKSPNIIFMQPHSYYSPKACFPSHSSYIITFHISDVLQLLLITQRGRCLYVEKHMWTAVGTNSKFDNRYVHTRLSFSRIYNLKENSRICVIQTVLGFCINFFPLK